MKNYASCHEQYVHYETFNFQEKPQLNSTKKCSNFTLTTGGGGGGGGGGAFGFN
jgi:hypothetical protein